jgi:CRISPR/Cas system-associated endoribonuclease Cas2
MKIKSLVVSISLVSVFGGYVFADVPQKSTTEGNPFCKKEKFPGDYFLIHTNLPHFMKIFRMHMDDKTLVLSKEQIQKLSAVQDDVITTLTPWANSIKEKELEVMQLSVYEGKNVEGLKNLLEEIAALRVKMSKKHVDCIHAFYTTLSKEQYRLLIEMTKGKK